MTKSAEQIARSLGAARRSGNGWMCRCPAHDDRVPSLAVTVEGGQVLVHCHAGCPQSAVIVKLRALGLWPDRTGIAVAVPKKSKEPRPAEPFPILPVPADAPPPPLEDPALGAPSLCWEYKSPDGATLGYIRRFDRPEGKTFRPLTFCQNPDGSRTWRSKGLPAPLPVFNLDHLAERADEHVLIVEGEKAADAAKALMPTMVVITWPGGAKNAARADWSPLADRHIYVWPDADPEGERAASEVARQCHRAGAASIRIITSQAGIRPKGWDAADAAEEGISIAELTKLFDNAVPFIADVAPLRAEIPATFSVPGAANGPVLKEWDASRFSGLPPEREWLIEGIIPLGVPVMLAAMGGVGKSMLTTKLALEIATGGSLVAVLGGEIQRDGTAVIITAEDDAKEIHRRLHQLDPDGHRHVEPHRLIVVPLPDAGGSLTILEGNYERPRITEAFESLKSQLRSIPDLRLVVLDPLQAFVGADINTDPAAAQYLCACLGALAIETGATILVTHHFRKQGDVNNPAKAREAVRGSSALIDGMRGVYALWPADDDHGRKIAAELGLEYRVGRVVHGAVVKANWPADLSVHTYVRNDDGLLVDRSNELRRDQFDRVELQQALVNAIEHAAENGKPYTKTGGNGVYKRRNELPPRLRMGRNRLEDFVQDALLAGLITQAAAKGSKSVHYLDVPSGPFDRGEGVFQQGAHRPPKP